ncbi:hypothetical protein AVEN_133510-1 [Araneus ventricosus]|uniref:Uncharacterized protein n=1 Tax=Araneus ventricosus TaxID=182803 RepID=A0A4Y2P3A9_ARAVE|nr:hypothetical protein AVEN_133510-1 [Araneus ventricosus]
MATPNINRYVFSGNDFLADIVTDQKVLEEDIPSISGHFTETNDQAETTNEDLNSIVISTCPTPESIRPFPKAQNFPNAWQSSKKNLECLTNLASASNVNGCEQLSEKGFEWKYSATPHGKGVVDGIGGTAKSRVYAEVKARAIVQNAIDFATVVTKVVPNITVISMLQNDIDKTQIDWNLAKNVPGIKKAYIVKISDDHVLVYQPTKFWILLYKSYAVVKIQISVSKVPNHLQKITLHL